MRKKLFIVLVVLMSLSLIGIISIQAYYIKNAIDNEKKQFAFNIKKVLDHVSNTVEKREFKEYFFKIQSLWDKGVKVDSTAIKNLYIRQDDKNNNQTLLYRNSVLEENYKLSSSLFDIGLDSINLKRILNERESKVFKTNDFEDNPSVTIENMLHQIGKISQSDKILFETAYADIAYRVPIHQRVSVDEISGLLSEKLQQDNIDLKFEFAIYSNDLATKIHSENFENKLHDTFETPIFINDNDQSDFWLLVNFPDHKKYIMSSIIGMILLSVVFTLIIILAYASAIFQLIKQRKISEIKTDFINNMTHEFKTPIATINLALDAIKNPKIIEDKSKVLRYLNMIKEENKRMHAQVENVLQISKLEKNELNISKEALQFHDIIEDAISHIELIVEDKNGSVSKSLIASNVTVLGNEMHLTNVIVNILDNAVKYSPNTPKIEVKTKNSGNYIVISVRDHGSGMSKAAQKRVFEKFYREHTGNIHNVKGHGLGLAYVKRIVDEHKGFITVESEKDKGSKFIIKLPLIS